MHYIYTVQLLFQSGKWINDNNFCKINCNLSLYSHISGIYPYTVNVYKNFVQAMFER